MEDKKGLFDLSVDFPTTQELNELSRWTRLFGILLLVATGLFLLMFLIGWDKIGALFAAALQTPGESQQIAMVFLLVAFLVVGGVIGALCFFLLRSAKRVRQAIRTNDQQLFNSGLADLKVFFITYGVISLLGFVLSLFSFLF